MKPRLLILCLAVMVGCGDKPPFIETHTTVEICTGRKITKVRRTVIEYSNSSTGQMHETIMVDTTWLDSSNCKHKRDSL